MWLTLGMRKKGFEIRSRGCGFTFDIFLNYKVNKTNQCTYYHVRNRL